MDLLKLCKQLYPSGRAWRIFPGSNLEKLHQSVNESLNNFETQLKAIYYTLLPDNDFFTESDAEVWENRLHLSSSGTLEDRKANISRRLNHPGGVFGRMSASYLQQQLQAAGFNVYVYQNKQGGVPINPVGAGGEATEHSLTTEHGDAYFGESNFSYDSVVINYDDRTRDPQAVNYTETQLKSTFFIGGSTFPSFAPVEAAREKEFRKLILTLKSQNMAAYLLISYI